MNPASPLPLPDPNLGFLICGYFWQDARMGVIGGVGDDRPRGLVDAAKGGGL